MSIPALITAAIVAVLAALIAGFAFTYRRSAHKPEAKPQRPVPDDPALPEIQTKAMERLLSLPHFRRILDGSLFDYYQGARLETCDCTKLPYPHLTLDYGGKLGVVFETASGLEHYVAVQEAVAAMLMVGMNSSASSAKEVC